MTGVCAALGMTGVCAALGMTGVCAALEMTGVCAALGMTVEVSCSKKLQLRKELPSNNRCASIRRKSLKLLAVIASKS